MIVRRGGGANIFKQCKSPLGSIELYTLSESTIAFEEPDLKLVKTWDMKSQLDERNTYVKNAKNVRNKGPNRGKSATKNTICSS